MDRESASTDPTGRCFVSYKRSRREEIERLVPMLQEHGIPTWQDTRNLASEPTIEAIERALGDPQTAGAILWLSRDVADSPVILQEEAPRILKRARQRDGFSAKLCLADGLEYKDATSILAKMPGTFEDPSKTWNLRPVEGNPATENSLIEIVDAAMRRRLRVLHASMPSDYPIRVKFNAHANATPGFELGYALLPNWTSHFELRHALEDTWQARLLPTLSRIAAAIRSEAPGRPVEADGFISIATSLALGRAFMEPGGWSLSWKQLPSGDFWTLANQPVDSGFNHSLVSHDPGATDLAVFISCRGSVEGAVAATPDLPPFRAVLKIESAAGNGYQSIDSPAQATHLARLVAEQIRIAQQRYPAVRRTHLFYSGPVGVSVMIGQQLNALGPIQTYEHTQSPDDRVGHYVNAATLSDDVYSPPPASDDIGARPGFLRRLVGWPSSTH